MKKRLIRACALLGMAASMAGCVFVFAGCQTRVVWEKYPETALPIQEVRPVNGVDQVITVGYQMAGGGFCVTARSPLFARESLNGFNAQTYTNGTFSASILRLRLQRRMRRFPRAAQRTPQARLCQK